MKKNKFLLVVVFFSLLFVLPLSTQANISIKGKVINYKTGEVIAFASISLKKTFVGTITNSEGVFELNMEDNYSGDSLFVSNIGYETSKIYIKNIMNEKQIVIKLKPTIYFLKSINIVATAKLTADNIIKNAKKNL